MRRQLTAFSNPLQISSVPGFGSYVQLNTMASGGHRGSPPPPPSRERPDPSDDEAEEPEGEGEPEEEESEGELKGEREQTAEDEAPAGDERKTKRDPRKWHMPSPGRWCWCIYVLPMLTLLLGLALICYIPWFFSKKALRPWLFIGSRTQRTLEVTEHFHGFYRAGHVQGKCQSTHAVKWN